MARPKKYKIDAEQVEKLASFGCTNKEIASFFGCEESLISKSYSRYITKGKAKGNIRLRQMQWKACENGNVSMLIWLGKQVLKQSESPENQVEELPTGFDLNEI
tara:strand:- start:3727 stop:4038 length:312 start_codon:yes stop_codon:yes gene_type:complete